MAKDDIVLGLGRPMYGTSVHANRKKAYPSVITTLAQMEPEARKWIALHNFLCRSYQDAEIIKKRYVYVFCADVHGKNPEPRDEPIRQKEYIKVLFGNTKEAFSMASSLEKFSNSLASLLE